ncbi:HisA/HisF-related TIM barrel protein [Streptomyces sp. S.PNR 29]|uniref:HisA/HisF-related TIM barrel protein n=1 Tax=Streptomyces sp. S.PNR 29 TaxID=2973805 RepID=UPI0025B0813E|nr:HisA/HisF-related TIM barrel protein [Streptomyces sp. S.PNR 29]MDN0199933.1 HisA/HisF-related TIM barrel protein [Streptomyces sp. S.PNR 29]
MDFIFMLTRDDRTVTDCLEACLSTNRHRTRRRLADGRHLDRGDPHLAGNPVRIADDCRRAEAAGCAGVDLLAYRATDADPLDLVRAARAATTGRLVVAGSIASTDQIEALASAGADAFTIGSAAFEGSLQPHAGTLRSQLAPVVGP